MQPNENVMMNRRKFIGLSTTLTAAAVLPSPIRALMMKNDSFRPLRGDVGIYTNRGGTIGWLSNSDALFVVDTQYPETAMDCLSGLLQQNDRRIDAVINTHHHGDHTGGNGVFRPYARKIVAHARVPELQKNAAERQNNAGSQTYPDQVYRDEFRLDAGNETISLNHNGPAHTGGDSVVSFEQANVVHMGDLMFNRIYPFIDVDGGASLKGWINTLKTVTDRFDRETIYIFGHAGGGEEISGDYNHIDFFRSYLEELNAFVSDGIREGKTADELKSTKTLPGFESMQSVGTFLSLASNIDAAYRDISREND